MPLPTGHVLHGKYRLVRLLGDGGMGAVYEAVHERLGTRVAIKVLHADLASRPGIVERFLQEARVSAQIRSVHVAQTIDVDRTPQGDAYIVMELLEGETLLALVERERKLSVGVACAFTLQILSGLEAAHDLDVVHRDLKPENVFVTHGTQKTVVKLIDFGIAKARRDGSANLTMAGITMGTAEYMAPEQAFSADRADARSDLYAVGVMLYEMLCGTRPIVGDDPRAIAIRVERGEVKPLVHALPSVPPPLAGLVHRAMAARPELRFQSAAEMRMALEKLVGHDAGGTLPLPLAAGRRAAASQDPPRSTATGTLRGTPVEEPLAFDQPRPSPEVFTDRSDPPPPPKHGSLVPLVALAMLLGIGAVVALAAAQGHHSSVAEQSAVASSAPAVRSLATVSATSANAPEPSASAPPPLAKAAITQPKRASIKSDAGVRASASADRAAPTATATSTQAFPFPNMQLPSALPPIPSALPPDLTLPGFGP